MRHSSTTGRIVSSRIASAVMSATLSLFTLSSQAEQHFQTLPTKIVRPAVSTGKAAPVGPLPLTQHLKLHIVLPVRDQAGVDSTLQQLYDPQSPSYRNWLSVKEFTDKFGPTQEDYQAVVDFAKANGLAIVGTPAPNRRMVAVDGPVDAINKTFHLTMTSYRHPTENRNFYSPDREPTLDLKVPIQHIEGLDNFSLPHSIDLKHSTTDNTLQTFAVGSGPGGQYLGSDMRAAYYGGGPLTGTGQYIGLFGGQYDMNDVKLYFSSVGQSFNPSVVQAVSVDDTETSCTGCDDGEIVIDIARSYSMAPGVSGIFEFVGGCEEDTLNAMATHDPLPMQNSSSIGCLPGSSIPAIESILQEMAAQGQSYFSASGDSAAFKTSDDNTGDTYPTESTWCTAAGGSDLNTNGAGGPWVSETAWADSGGGPSPDGFAIPSWQQLPGVINSSNGGSTTLRNLPDVASEANFDNYFCDEGVCQGGLGGTSFSSPTWAGFMALVNQQAVANGKPTAGLLNPTIYAIGTGSSYNSDFHDITSGNNNNGVGQSYNAVTGYDLVTGWGTPNGQSLINALSESTAPESTCHVSYTINSQWAGGFNAGLTIENTGTTALTHWTLTWAFGNGQTITSLWDGNESQSGSNVTVTNLGYNGNIPAGGSFTGVGFNGTWNNIANAAPTSFAINGNPCD